jgi:predicted DNA-binding transcriptional regulator YafY
MSLPPLNFTPAEAVAVAVGLRRLDDTPYARAARSALLKIVSAMPADAATQARLLADRVRLLAKPVTSASQQIADAVLLAIEAATPIRIDYLDVGGQPTERVVEPYQVVLGPSGSYVTGWCRLRADQRIFRLDRISAVEPVEGVYTHAVRDFAVDEYESRSAAWS